MLSLKSKVGECNGWAFFPEVPFPINIKQLGRSEDRKAKSSEKSIGEQSPLILSGPIIFDMQEIIF
tara:strand:+ start:398 stop:595 length:198 start_codon:yes stop_codon:yes gene_type:complete